MSTEPTNSRPAAISAPMGSSFSGPSSYPGDAKLACPPGCHSQFTVRISGVHSRGLSNALGLNGSFRLADASGCDSASLADASACDGSVPLACASGFDEPGCDSASLADDSGFDRSDELLSLRNMGCSFDWARQRCLPSARNLRDVEIMSSGLLSPIRATTDGARVDHFLKDTDDHFNLARHANLPVKPLEVSIERVSRHIQARRDRLPRPVVKDLLHNVQLDWRKPEPPCEILPGFGGQQGAAAAAFLKLCRVAARTALGDEARKGIGGGRRRADIIDPLSESGRLAIAFAQHGVRLALSIPKREQAGVARTPRTRGNTCLNLIRHNDLLSRTSCAESAPPIHSLILSLSATAQSSAAQRSVFAHEKQRLFPPRWPPCKTQALL